MKPRLAYVTHVDWGHIRQRPQQLAVALAAHFDVTVLSPVGRRRGDMIVNAAPGLKLARVWRLPGSYRSAGIVTLNGALAAIQCASQIRKAAAVIVTSPELWPWVAPVLGRRTLVYDCMDDALAFAQDPAVREAKARWEGALLGRADAVVCTSDELAGRLIRRGALPARTSVVPNGWDPLAFPLAPSRPLPAHGPLTLAYFGTIGPWLDVAALRAIVAAEPSVSIRLIGPLDGARLDRLPGVRVEPPVRHDALASTVATADALLLPFVVDELTRAVDPVKIYEYIALGLPIASAHWPALDRFAPFVTFYRGADELADLVRRRALATPPASAARAAFLAANRWEARADAIRGVLSTPRD